MEAVNGFSHSPKTISDEFASDHVTVNVTQTAVTSLLLQHSHVADNNSDTEPFEDTCFVVNSSEPEIHSEPQMNANEAQSVTVNQNLNMQNTTVGRTQSVSKDRRKSLPQKHEDSSCYSTIDKL